MTVSIIIAVKTWAKNLQECVGKYRQLDYPEFEILVLPDSHDDGDCPRTGTVPIKIIPTGPVNPAKKRDVALRHAKGEILAFIDDDAYPRNDWLKNAVVNFQDKDVAAVGGPAITPPEDNLKQKASGIIYSSFLVSGQYRYRYVAGERREVDDYPSCNFLVRKTIMQELGGFKTNFWPGEDTKLCLDITKALKKKIIYDPAVVVFHHRRAVFGGHLKQIASYALHRGYFVKKYPQTSFRLSYFIPTLFLFAVLTGGVLSVFFSILRMVYFFSIFLYLSLVFIFSLSSNLNLIPLVFSGIILTHLTYGAYFVKGILSWRLKEE